MPLVLTAGPAVEPVTVAEARAHLRLDTDAEDTLVASLVVTARLHVEATMGLALVTQSWSWFLDAWPSGPVIVLPLRPVASIVAVRTYDESAAATPLDPAGYFLDGAGNPARLVRQGASPWPRPGRPANGIEIAVEAGFGPAAADVPPPIRHAILLLVAHWHEHRSPVEAGAGAAVEPPHTVADLLAPYRSPRL